NTDEIVQTIFMRYQEIGHFFGVADEDLKVIKEILLALPSRNHPNSSYLMAAFKAHGERLNARLIDMILQHQDGKSSQLNAKQAELIVTSEAKDELVNQESDQNHD